MTPLSRYHKRLGAPQLFAPGTPTPVVNYDPHWCGQEVCGPPPGATATTQPKIIRLPFAHQAPAATPAPVTPAPPPATPVHIIPIPRVTAPAPPAPPVTFSPPTGGGDEGAPAPTEESSCSCSWIPPLLIAAIAATATYVAQTKKKPRLRRAA